MDEYRTNIDILERNQKRLARSRLMTVSERDGTIETKRLVYNTPVGIRYGSPPPVTPFSRPTHAIQPAKQINYSSRTPLRPNAYSVLSGYTPDPASIRATELQRHKTIDNS